MTIADPTRHQMSDPTRYQISDPTKQQISKAHFFAEKTSGAMCMHACVGATICDPTKPQISKSDFLCCDAIASCWNHCRIDNNCWPNKTSDFDPTWYQISDPTKHQISIVKFLYWTSASSFAPFGDCYFLNIWKSIKNRKFLNSLRNT